MCEHLTTTLSQDHASMHLWISLSRMRIHWHQSSQSPSQHSIRHLVCRSKSHNDRQLVDPSSSLNVIHKPHLLVSTRMTRRRAVHLWMCLLLQMRDSSHYHVWMRLWLGLRGLLCRVCTSWESSRTKVSPHILLQDKRLHKDEPLYVCSSVLSRSL